MMLKMPIICALMAGCATTVLAQDMPEEVHTKKFEHTVGVQMNSLIRQVANFSSNNTTAVVNPYDLIYTINHAKTGWGVRIGVGYHYLTSNTNDGISEVETRINDLNGRLGIEKRFKFSKRWSAGVGIDGLYNTSDDYTKSVIRSFDTVTTITKSKLPAYGGGAMGWLRFNITEKIQIGTEASFYYTTGTQDNYREVTQRVQSTTPPFTRNWETKITTSKPKSSEGIFRSPIVFFLLVKF